MSGDCSTWLDEEWSDRGAPIHLDQLYWRKCLITTILRRNTGAAGASVGVVSSMAHNSPVDEMESQTINEPIWLLINY